MSAPGVAHGPAAAPVSTSSDAAVRSAFAKFDKNGSGALDVRELRSALGQLGLEAGRTEAQAILSKYDADGGGSLELSEFQALVSAASSTSDSLVTDPIRRAFEALDRDHSGSLDSRELRSALRKLGLTEVDADATKAIMRKYDTDKGGRIELVEFASLV
ncbi:hypothetical protein EMIHUDRAFT_70822, partial [Emiliania huxleyi CCMP1516]|uniref:EF-hand domain-containing protein n=2 Tax=Emiliania huxleyi TaxID=2903 RepID=A0A0D3KKL9_EMIH1